MIPLDTLKQQHEEIKELLNVLSLLIPDEQARKSRIVEGLLKDLAKKVGDHLALEDDTLYKELLVHPDPNLQRTARNFLSGSHELRRLFTNYVQHACKPASKHKECEEFVKESEELFELLEQRVQIEESKFYPLAEKA
jgi:hemerythrin-like domain-containing protein